jgi:hypothetical protein
MAMAARFLGIAACGFNQAAADRLLFGVVGGAVIELPPTAPRTPVEGDGTAAAPQTHWRCRRSVFALTGVLTASAW